jgi:transposase
MVLVTKWLHQGRFTWPPIRDGAAHLSVTQLAMQTARLNDVDPQTWLADVLARLQDHPAKRINELLPWNWKRERLQLAAA